MVRSEPADPLRRGAGAGAEDPVVEALAAVTIRAAWQYFEEGEKGSLREGKRADLVLLERDPLTADPMSLRDIPVLATWKDGTADLPAGEG